VCMGRCCKEIKEKNVEIEETEGRKDEKRV
jgi:hypothetical protein